MYGLSNGMNTNDLELVWGSLLLLRVTKRSLCICRPLYNFLHWGLTS